METKVMLVSPHRGCSEILTDFNEDVKQEYLKTLVEVKNTEIKRLIGDLYNKSVKSVFKSAHKSDNYVITIN